MTDPDSGLPELKKEEDKKSNKKPPIWFFVVLALLLAGTVFGVQVAIDKGGFFEKKVVEYSEPPIPVFEVGEDNESTGEIEVGSISDSSIAQDELESVVDNGNDDIAIDSKVGVFSSTDGDLKKDDVDHLLRVMEDVLEKMNSQGTELAEIRAKQGEIVQKVETLGVENNEGQNSLSEKQKDNGRWLQGITNQLKAIGLEVKGANEKFELIVYHKNIWGSEVYITVAPREHPSQTRFMKIGEYSGGWKLESISEDTAIFRHIDGIAKEVGLQ